MSLLVGYGAEDQAVAYLKKKNFKILDRNIRFPFGEIDIVAWDKETMVFVEVKKRRDTSMADPFESVTKSKQRKIIKAAHAYLQKLPSPLPICRFDVVAITGDEKNPNIEHILDAFYENC